MNRINALRSYGGNYYQEEAVIARFTQDPEIQKRIAENSENRLVLLNLALNKNLEEETVKALFDRDKTYLTKRLNALGYKEGWL
jgi:hypothetical protein